MMPSLDLDASIERLQIKNATLPEQLVGLGFYFLLTASLEDVLAWVGDEISAEQVEKLVKEVKAAAVYVDDVQTAA